MTRAKCGTASLQMRASVHRCARRWHGLSADARAGWHALSADARAGWHAARQMRTAVGRCARMSTDARAGWHGLSADARAWWHGLSEDARAGWHGRSADARAVWHALSADLRARGAQPLGRCARLVRRNGKTMSSPISFQKLPHYNFTINHT
jgi:hypothetical protein